MPTKQETFETVATHLLKQNCRALNNRGMCRYRTTEGLKCAVGCLIPESRYTPQMENFGGLSDNFLVAELMEELGHDTSLLQSLQGLHDFMEDPLSWKHRLRRIGELEGLDTSFLAC